MNGVEGTFEVGVVLRRGADGPGDLRPPADRAGDAEAQDGYEEAVSLGGWWGAGRDKVAELGEGAVRLASTAVATQVATVAEQIASKLDQSAIAQGGAGRLALDSVELTFGVALTAGTGSAINAFVTAEGESSFTVTISLSRRPG